MEDGFLISELSELKEIHKECEIISSVFVDYILMTE